LAYFPRLAVAMTLGAAARWTRKSILDSHSTGVPFGEESITESVLLRISMKYPGRVITRSFSKWEESRQTGADWEWWITDGGSGDWLGIRVQAKKIRDLSRSRKGYRVGYQPQGQSVRQIDRLLSDAAGSGMIPVVAFYSSLNNSASTRCCLTTGPQLRDPGVTICSAVGARAALGSRNEYVLDDIANSLSIPWSCPFACQGTSSGDLNEFLSGQSPNWNLATHWILDVLATRLGDVGGNVVEPRYNEVGIFDASHVPQRVMLAARSSAVSWREVEDDLTDVLPSTKFISILNMDPAIDGISSRH